VYLPILAPLIFPFGIVLFAIFTGKLKKLFKKSDVEAAQPVQVKEKDE